MCGIAGLLVAPRAGHTDDPHSIVARMADALAHRGPDGRGVQTVSGATETSSEPAVVLGHTRLAIIDLSPAGSQPMQIDGGRYWATFNGEIYNFRALRDRLPGPWTTGSDTEVLLRAYAAWGRGCLDELDGMFAFGIWDSARQELFLARDRLGVKPLYYVRDGGCFAFASEVRALLETRLSPWTLDPVTLDQYLGYQCAPAPRTLVAGIRLLEPGTCMRVDTRGQIHTERYWDLLENAPCAVRSVSSDESRVQVGQLLHAAVERHLVSDVPVGAFLSGGIDSTALVAVASDLGYALQTFSVAFSEEDYDESLHARAVAEHFKTDHTEIRLSAADILDQIPAALAAMDQPSGDAVNTYVVSRAVRQAGVKVALSGLGGDELFGGYPSFRRLSRWAEYARLARVTPRSVRSMAAATVRMATRSSIAGTKLSAMVQSDGSLARLYPTTRQVLSMHQRRQLLGSAAAGEDADPYQSLLGDAFARAGSRGVITRVSYAEARTYMHDLLLRDADQMSMAHALEVRVPLLDHALAEYVVALPDALKWPGSVPKRLLVDSLGVDLPDALVRRKKQGFTLPFDVWMRGALLDFCAGHLEALGERGIFRADGVRSLWQDFLERRPSVSWSRVWHLVALDQWLERMPVSTSR